MKLSVSKSMKNYFASVVACSVHASQELHSRIKSPSIKVLLVLVALFISQASQAAGTTIDPKKVLGYAKWVVTVILGISGLCLIGKGMHDWQIDQSKGKQSLMAGIIGIVFAIIFNYIFEKAFGSESVVDNVSDL